MIFRKPFQIIYLFSAVSILLLLTIPVQGGQAFIQGRAAVAEEDYSRGIELLRIAIQEEGSNPEAWRLLGFSYRMVDSLSAAVSAYEQVLKLQPEDYDAKLALGALLAHAGETEASIGMYGHILQTDSTDVEAWLGIGRSRSWQNDLSEAETAYRTALLFKPGYPRGLLGLAEVLAWQDRSREAQDVYDQLLETDSTYAEAWSGLGNSWYWSDRPYRALDCYDKSITLDNNPQVNEQIARVSKQVSWYHEPRYSYMVEDDAGLETESETISLSSGKRINDVFEIGGSVAAFSSYRDGLWEYRRRIGLRGVIHTIPGITLQPETRVDVLSGDIDLLQIQGNLRGQGRWNWIQGQLRYESMLYELWSNTRASGGWGELAFSRPELFKLTVGAGRWELSDENEKVQASVNLDIKVLGKDGISLLLNSRYLDFRNNVIGYWTPHKLRYDGAGILIETHVNSTIHLFGYGEFAVNTDQNRFVRINGSVRFDLSDSYSISTDVTYFETDTSYRMLLWNVSLLAGGLF